MRMRRWVCRGNSVSVGHGCKLLWGTIRGRGGKENILPQRMLLKYAKGRRPQTVTQKSWAGPEISSKPRALKEMGGVSQKEECAACSSCYQLAFLLTGYRNQKARNIPSLNQRKVFPWFGEARKSQINLPRTSVSISHCSPTPKQNARALLTTKCISTCLMPPVP